MNTESWFFTSNSIIEYAEVTSRALCHNIKPTAVVAMVRSFRSPVKYTNHKSIVGIGMVNGKLDVYCEEPQTIPHVTIQEIRKTFPLYRENN